MSMAVQRYVIDCLPACLPHPSHTSHAHTHTHSDRLQAFRYSLFSSEYFCFSSRAFKKNWTGSGEFPTSGPGVIIDVLLVF